MPDSPDIPDIPRHLLAALRHMQRAFEQCDSSSLATINENLQPVADAAMGWISSLRRDREEAWRERDEARRERDDLHARLTREAATHAAREGELSRLVADLQGQLRDADATAAGLRAVYRAAVARADEAEAKLDALHERLLTADVPWRLPGCECPVDSKPADRCDSRWTRCNARLSYQRAVKATERA